MNHFAFSLQNVVDANGVIISVMGMLIVFSALTVIALFIAALPKLLPLFDKILPEEHHHHEAVPSRPADHEQVLAAIGYALFRKHAETLPAE
ncbi:MAG: hypothetical protein C0618_06480 [Desulfuromonas sp.]|nr:MAG: hypothetical protein C0618_06480 [Desulfuromonas sp.]